MNIIISKFFNFQITKFSNLMSQISDLYSIFLYLQKLLKMDIKEKYNSRRKPDWLKIRLPQNSNFSDVHKIVEKYSLNTICTSGKCPNLGECWDRGTATIMILGDICTRACKFCAVKTEIGRASCRERV